MSNVWVIVRDDNDGAGGSEVLGVYTVDALALATVEELNRAAAGSGAAERFRAVRVGLNSHDKLPGQWAESSIEVMRGVFVESWAVEDYVPLSSLRLHRPEWQPWPTVSGDRLADEPGRRVRELHAAKPCGCCCAHCDNGWPCPTIEALDGGDA